MESLLVLLAVATAGGLLVRLAYRRATGGGSDGRCSGACPTCRGAQTAGCAEGPKSGVSGPESATMSSHQKHPTVSF